MPLSTQLTNAYEAKMTCNQVAINSAICEANLLLSNNVAMSLYIIIVSCTSQHTWQICNPSVLPLPSRHRPLCDRHCSFQEV